MSNISKQRGVVLLAMMLVLIVSTSFVLISNLNANVRQFPRQSSSMPILNEAKAALIGYAVTYPERSGNPDGAPGTLPCPEIYTAALPLPDPWPTGQAGGNCSFPNTIIGRFPWATLNIEKTTDYNGEELWYVVANNYRTPAPGAINSESAGDLILDGDADIVALIIAPGPPLTGQNRATDANKLDYANYLEGENADAPPNDVNYVSRAAGEFNDTVIAITRQELMQVVEKRVLGDVAQAMTNYRTANAAFPWLTPFTNPSTSVYRGQSTTMQGHIPFHWAADPDSISVPGAGSIAGRNPFSTDLALRWDDITGADISAPINPLAWLGLANLVSAACLNDINDCDEGALYPEITSISPAANIDCTWSDRNTADCSSVSQSFTRNFTSGTCAPGLITRTYTVDFPEFTGNSTIINQTAADVRRRNVSLTTVNPDFIPAQANAITVVETLTGQIDVLGFFCANVVNFDIETRTSTFDADTDGSLVVNGMQYDVDIDNAELPTWFVNNEWQELIYIAYASGEAVLPGDTTPDQDCATLGNCISVASDGVVYSNTTRAVAISAGVGTTRPGNLLTDYFEGENSNPIDDVFIKNDITTVTNDQTRIICDGAEYPC
ncbi:MAG: hypothetical protein GKR93_04320 [Gammaproteobacteria bacterium]|nr:hypothetical protein [Gammaproteobacteria bacterium]